MKTVILCGGQGTRLKEETEYRPKPLVEIGGKPILWHIMKIYAHYGFNDFILCLGYKGDLIKQYFLNYEAMNNDFTIELGQKNAIQFHGKHSESHFKVTLVHTGNDTMTGARVKQIERFITEDDFMVTYGDGLADINIANLVKFHKETGKIGTVSTVRPSSRFGILELDQNKAVQRFSEKPQLDGWISAGFFVFNRKFFNYLKEDPQCILERQPLEDLSRDNQLFAYQHDSYFHAMDTYREFLALNDLWNKKIAPWKMWNDDDLVEKRSRISSQVRNESNLHYTQ